MAKSDPRETVRRKSPSVRRTVKKEQREKYFDALLGEGLGHMAATAKAGVDPKTAKKWREDYEADTGETYSSMLVKGPKSRHLLSPDPRRALEDFSYFQERYLGRVALPWQKTAADSIVKYVASPEKEFLVINCPPGSGKSSLVIHDIGAWVIARNRGIRICVISSTQKNAEKFANQLRRTLEATVPIKADAKALTDGTAKDAITTLSRDFGRFKPEIANTWTKNRFQVDRPGQDAANKENTVEAYGRDQAFLGGRYDLVICDDYQDPTSIRTPEALAELKEHYSDVVESRLEPSGLLVLNMQRVGADDISNYALEMEAYSLEDDDDVDPDDLAALLKEREKYGIEPLPIRDGRPRKYRHIAFKAHYDGEECKGAKFHGRNAPAYPDGCLLFPKRLPYGELKTKEKNNPGKFRLWYQQEEVEIGNILIEPIWIKGGRDDYGVERPGCWDRSRSARTLPPGLSNEIFSFIAVDPSPSQYWGVGWWIYHRPSEELYLIDLVRQRMTSPEFFDQNPNTGECTGVLVDMYQSSREIGAPITHLIAEVNAAQKFMYQSSAIVQWIRAHSIALMPHTTTGQNKNSQELGVQTLQPWFRDGRIRLPGAQGDAINSRVRSLKLVDEATRYKLDGTTTTTTDCVMQTWFAAMAVRNLYRKKAEMPQMWRPSWMSGRPNLKVVA